MDLISVPTPNDRLAGSILPPPPHRSHLGNGGPRRAGRAEKRVEEIAAGAESGRHYLPRDEPHASRLEIAAACAARIGFSPSIGIGGGTAIDLKAV